MNDIVHKKIKQIEVVCEDGTLITLVGAGTIHINNSEIKTEKGQPNLATRQAIVSLSVDSEKETNGA